MIAQIKPFKFEFLSPTFSDSVAFGSIKYLPAPSPPFESGLEHFNVALLLITSHVKSPKRESNANPWVTQ